MSGIAKTLLELGCQISGSDLKASEITKRLESMGADIYIGHRAENLNPKIRTVVVSSAIPKNNAEVIRAAELGIPIVQRAQMLDWLMTRQKGIAIAGAHGKTTTSSMISLIFEKNGYDPTVVVGGELNDIGGNAKLGKGEYLVAEADESDGSFLKLHPFITVITNIEDDHLDYYGTRENIEKAFQQFILDTPADGFTVLCQESPVIQKMVLQIRETKRVITYGLSPQADIWVSNIRLNGLLTKSTVLQGQKVLGELQLSVPGTHNILNALAAVAVGINCGLSFTEISKTLRSFCGVQRRFQKIGDAQGIQIYDDYAHHPSEIKATLSAARTLRPGRIIAVFQPHRFSRTQLLAREFGTAFQNADIILIDEIYPAGEKPIPGVNAQLILEEIKKQDPRKFLYLSAKGTIISKLLELIQAGDLVITLGAGNIVSAGHELLKSLTTENRR